MTADIVYFTLWGLFLFFILWVGIIAPLRNRAFHREVLAPIRWLLGKEI